jgi:phage/plasmid-like protein (TIGR03299 family)
MGHNLNIKDGNASMMYVGETPWHRLGTKLEKPATAAEAIQAAGLDFTVQMMSLRTEHADIPVERHFATVRMDSFQALGVVGARYTPIQNKDAFFMFDALVGEGEAIYHTAGALGKGERIWLLAKLPDYIRVNGTDIVEKYLLLTNSHDGSEVVRVKLTPIRVVCDNTLAAALEGAEQEVRIRHTANAQIKLKQAHEILGLSNWLYAELDRIFNGMSKRKLTGEEMKGYVRAVFPEPPRVYHRSQAPRIHEKVTELAETGAGAELARGTLWGAYNAVTEFVDHCRLSRADDSARLKSMWFGSGERIKKQAFKVAVVMLN